MSRIDQLIDELRKWCDAKHGRRTELAHHLGVSRQTVHAWLNRTKVPGGEEVLAIQELLRGP